MHLFTVSSAGILVVLTWLQSGASGSLTQFLRSHQKCKHTCRLTTLEKIMPTVPLTPVSLTLVLADY